jgi:hypothetical protein
MEQTYRIKVSFKTFPSYAPILKWYNDNKPAEWQQIEEAGICEGGFQVPLTSTEVDLLRERYPVMLNPNHYVRQLKWHNGELREHHSYATPRNEEIVLLGKALQAVFGEDKVEIIKTEY